MGHGGWGAGAGGSELLRPSEPEEEAAEAGTGENNGGEERPDEATGPGLGGAQLGETCPLLEACGGKAGVPLTRDMSETLQPALSRWQGGRAPPGLCNEGGERHRGLGRWRGAREGGGGTGGWGGPVRDIRWQCGVTCEAWWGAKGGGARVPCRGILWGCPEAYLCHRRTWPKPETLWQFIGWVPAHPTAIHKTHTIHRTRACAHTFWIWEASAALGRRCPQLFAVRHVVGEASAGRSVRARRGACL